MEDCITEGCSVDQQNLFISRSGDETEHLLEDGYWGSYNLPFFQEVFELSGCAAMEKQYGNDYSWAHCPRANIFRRNESMVVDMESMKALMQYNNFRTDPLSEGDPFNAIAARGDLSQQPVPAGSLDSKVAYGHGVPKMTCDAICGAN